eukprot:4411065-Amphidinium_carterae.1
MPNNCWPANSSFPRKLSKSSLVAEPFTIMASIPEHIDSTLSDLFFTKARPLTNNLKSKTTPK